VTIRLDPAPLTTMRTGPSKARRAAHNDCSTRASASSLVCHGQPTIRDLRYTVEGLLELLAAGVTIDELLDDYPDLERDDVLAALEFAALTVGRRRIVPLSAA
jgi:uncharacterized protein (DUF433 family)